MTSGRPASCSTAAREATGPGLTSAGAPDQGQRDGLADAGAELDLGTRCDLVYLLPEPVYHQQVAQLLERTAVS